MTAQQLRILMVSAESLEDIELARTAHNKWVRQFASNILVALCLHESVGPMNARRKWLQEQESQGIDAALRRSRRDRVIQTVWAEESPHEASSLWQAYVDGRAERDEEMKNLIRSIRRFIAG